MNHAAADSPVPATPAGQRPATRLAPSPTGALHLGNARTFLVTWAIARARSWRLVLRIEDLDTPRVRPGASEAIGATLSRLGMDWDGPPLVQTEDLEPYRAAMRSLASRGLVYPCALSRAEVEAAASAPQEGSHEVVYPASLRPALGPVDFDAFEPGATNWRFATPAGDRAVVEFVDDFAGPRRVDAAATIGDFIVWTKRDQPSYQLAVVVDDHRQRVTDVIRGDDLIESAARQLLLYRALGLAPEPRHVHLPLVVGADGRRLAKRHGDTRVDRYLDAGVPPEAIVGLIARWSGVPTGPDGMMSASELKDRLDPASIPPNPVVFTPENDAWLLGRAG
jgi:glutamyl-tRNA synthetase